jgi:hypothetical protein
MTRTAFPAALAMLVTSIALAACTLGDVSVFGGRPGCWDEGEPLVASVVAGELRLVDGAPHLSTTDGALVPLRLNRFDVQSGKPVRTLSDPGAGEVAADGELVTLFGGLDADGSLYVCTVDARSTP